MRKAWLINGILLIGSILVFFLIVELGLRITGLQRTSPNPPKIFQTSEHPDIRYELKSNLKKEKAYKAKISTNSLGFRSPELIEDTPTVAVFGDSITFGYGVNDDQTLTAYMAGLLPGYNLINTAVPGYNLEQETDILRKKIVPIDPEIIVLVFYFNDLGGTAGFMDDQGILRPKGWDPSQETCKPITNGIMNYLPGKCWLAERSAFYKAFKKVYDLQAGKKRKKAEQKSSVENPEEDSVEQNELTQYSIQLEKFSKLIPLDRKYFVIWPDQELHEPTRPRLKKIAEAYEFEVIDLYETFGNQVPTLSLDTVHPNPEALERAAGVIVDRIN
jgi:lysophospholipase L1-like esterase|tara:strand:- start:65 stop:1057 length:993 start_codon:yes stop_codon:yes gene_type:complete